MYKNFQETVWSSKIESDLPMLMVSADFCDYEFEGEIKYANTLKIRNLARPTSKTYTPGVDIDKPETPDASTVDLKIDQADYTNVYVEDIDAAQMKKGVIEKLTKESKQVLAEKADKHVCSLASSATHISEELQLNKDNALDALDEGLQSLQEHNVPLNTEVAIEVAPWMYTLIKKNLITASTGNVDLLKKGNVGMYGNAHVKLTNNLYTNGGFTYAMVRTRKAIAFANAIQSVEPYRPEKGFGDALKILHVYGAKIVRPNELYVIKCKKAAAAA